MPIHTHADLAPVHCGRHLHPDAARDQAQGHFVRPGGVLLRGLEHERVVLAGSPSWAAPHRRAQLQVTRRRRRSTWACCAQPPSSSSSAPRRRRSPRRRGRRSPLGLPKDSYQSAKTELCVCVMLVLVRARARVNSRRVNESQITSGVMHYFMEPPLLLLVLVCGNAAHRCMAALAGRLRAGGADAQLQPTQRGVNLGVVGAGGAHVCAKRNFQFSIKILFKIRGRRREIWGSK